MSKYSREVEHMIRAWPGDLPELTAEQAKQIIPRVEHTGPLKIAKRSEATGPQRSDSGALDRDNELSIRAMAFKGYIDLSEDEEMVLDDAVHAYQTAFPDLITIELTREEAEEVVAQLKPDYPYERDKYAGDPMFTAEAKLRAALKGNP